jgi:hypothetical protein
MAKAPLHALPFAFNQPRSRGAGASLSIAARARAGSNTAGHLIAGLGRCSPKALEPQHQAHRASQQNRAPMTASGLGRVKTKVLVARMEYFERIAQGGSQIILRG